MNRLTCLFKLLKDPQIISALLWAITILLCSYFPDKETVMMVLITVSGFHVLLMNEFSKQKTSQEMS